MLANVTFNPVVQIPAWVRRVMELIGRAAGARGANGRLQTLDEALGGRRMARVDHVGRQMVAISQVRGTTSPSRCHDFDTNFRLRSRHGQSRWDGVLQAWRRRTLPPVALVQMGDTYFVQDGHHRVSVAHACGHELIAADVTVVVAA